MEPGDSRPHSNIYKAVSGSEKIVESSFNRQKWRGLLHEAKGCSTLEKEKEENRLSVHVLCVLPCVALGGGLLHSAEHRSEKSANCVRVAPVQVINMILVTL